MSIQGIKVTGGQLNQPMMTSNVSDAEYAVHKAFQWLAMLQDRMVPVKWFKATKKGTKINFTVLRTQEQFEDQMTQLKAYIAEVNEKHGAGLELAEEEADATV